MTQNSETSSVHYVSNNTQRTACNGIPTTSQYKVLACCPHWYNIRVFSMRQLAWYFATGWKLAVAAAVAAAAAGCLTALPHLQLYCFVCL